MNILVTGGTGYIGSHTVVSLVENGHDVIILDNLSNSKIEVLDRLKQITNKSFKFYKLDLLDNLDVVFQENKIDCVIHFAGLKAVGESVSLPLMYYENNITGTLNLLKAMEKYQVYKLVFSSSATVYGFPEINPIDESATLNPQSPYGRTKLYIENILRDLAISNNSFSIGILRYFNPIGAHKSYLLGDDPSGIPNNLLPYISKVVSGEFESLNVFGNDYDTVDGTGVRDYIHVCDLAYGHVLMVNKLKTNTGVFTYNLGTGCGYSVLEVVKAFEESNNVVIPFLIKNRRSGDVATCFADPSKALKELGFKTTKTIKEMCYDQYQFEMNLKKR